MITRLTNLGIVGLLKNYNSRLNRQVEFNLVAASSGSLGEGVFNYHQTLLRRHGVDTSQHNHRVNIVRGNAVV